MADAIFKQKEKIMNKFSRIDATVLLIWLLPLLYLFKVLPTLPETVPVHFGGDGKPDRYGSPAEFGTGISIVSFVALAVYFLVKFLPSIDPKKAAKLPQATFNKIAVVVILFLSVINCAIIYATANNGFNITKLIIPMMGLLFAFLGNLMYNIKPNYFAGIRTPWTLESEATWKATHRLAGKLWFFGGLIVAISTLFITGSIGFIIFISITTIITIIPVVYSYIYFKK
jgi:uncharacterized membrane protein